MLSHRVLGLQESAIRKLDRLVARQEGVRFHRLNIGQPDVATPEPLLRAIRDYCPTVLAYGPSLGMPACRDAAARYHARWGEGLGAEHVAVTTGGSEALLFAFTSTCDPGDEVLVPEPFYTNFTGFAAMAGARIRPVPTRLDQGFALPSDEALDAHLTDRTRALLFANPGNPTGAVYEADEVARLVAWTRRRGVFLIADEVYRRIWFDAPPASALAWPDPHVVVVDSVSKTYSACGVRLGFLLTRNLDLMERIDRLGQARLGPQPLAQAVGIAALSLPEAHYEALREDYRERVGALVDALVAIPGVRCHRPRGAFYTMARLPIDDAEAFARFLVTTFRQDGESVLLAPGSGFYGEPGLGRDEVRLAAVADASTLRRAVGLLGEALDAWRDGAQVGRAGSPGGTDAARP